MFQMDGNKKYTIFNTKDYINIEIQSNNNTNHKEIFNIINSNKNKLININSEYYDGYYELLEYIFKDIHKYILKLPFLEIKCSGINIYEYLNLIKEIHKTCYIQITNLIEYNSNLIIITFGYVLSTDRDLYNNNKIYNILYNTVINPYYIYIYEDEFGFYKNYLDLLYNLKCTNIKLNLSDEFKINHTSFNKLLIELNVYKLNINKNIGKSLQNTFVKKLNYNCYEIDSELLLFIENKCIRDRKSVV